MEERIAAQVHEIFTSIEGEGLFAGRPSTFVRFSGCNLECSYCDTGYARKSGGSALVDDNGTALEIANPVALDAMVALLGERLSAAPTVVFTGGEPLLQPAFLGQAAGRLKRLGFAIHLETNGTLPDALREVKEAIDFISMDVKLPSALGGRRLFDAHHDFLKTAEGRAAAVKVVLTDKSGDAEISEAIDIVASVNRFLPLLLQPAFEDLRPAVPPELVFRALAAARRKLNDVRVSIQMHKVLGVR